MNVFATNRQRYREEIWNTITHGLGLVMSIAGLVWLVAVAGEQGSLMKIFCFAVYGLSLVVLYGTSTLYHAVLTKVRETKLQRLDHAAIYFLIAGSYTPWTLLVLEGAWGWSIFGVQWFMAIGGMIYKLRYRLQNNRLSAYVYVAMGWLIIIAIVPLIERMPTGAWAFLAGGGLSYTIGVIFYLWERLPYNHAIWHLFVLGGSIGHFAGVALYLV